MRECIFSWENLLPVFLQHMQLVLATCIPHEMFSSGHDCFINVLLYLSHTHTQTKKQANKYQTGALFTFSRCKCPLLMFSALSWMTWGNIKVHAICINRFKLHCKTVKSFGKSNIELMESDVHKCLVLILLRMMFENVFLSLSLFG